MEKIYQELTKCLLFRGMDADQIQNIISTGDVSITPYKKGEVIARRDTAYSGLMIIIKGKAAGILKYPSGETANVEALDAAEAPQLIAPAFLFGGYNRLPVDVVACNDVEILMLHRGYLFELMQEHTLILSNFIDIISNRAGVWQKKIYALSFKSLKEKLASYLLDHSSEKNNIVMVPDIRETADYFAATRSSLAAVIEGLAKKSVLRYDGNKIEILNRDFLKDILK